MDISSLCTAPPRRFPTYTEHHRPSTAITEKDIIRPPPASKRDSLPVSENCITRPPPSSRRMASPRPPTSSRQGVGQRAALVNLTLGRTTGLAQAVAPLSMVKDAGGRRLHRQIPIYPAVILWPGSPRRKPRPTAQQATTQTASCLLR